MLGATGSGKSFLFNFLTTHAQKYEPLTVISTSATAIETRAGPRRKLPRVGLRETHGFTIDPFACRRTRKLHFLHAFVRVLLEGADSYQLTDAEDRELYEVALEYLRP